MTQEKIKTKIPKLPVIKCPECEFILTDELTYKIAHEKSIVCEQCGEIISDISPVYRNIILQHEKAHYTKKQQIMASSRMSFISKVKLKWKQYKIRFHAWFKRIKRKFQKKINATINNGENSSLEDSSPSHNAEQNEKRAAILTMYKLTPSVDDQSINQNLPNTNQQAPENSVNQTENLEKTSQNESENHLLIGRSEVFTVLELDIKNRLLALPITHYEQDIMAKSFIYMSLDQQRKYLTEIEDNSQIQSETAKQLITVIENLPIPQHQKKVLIDQLNYIPDTDHQEFLENLTQEKEEILTNHKRMPLSS